MVDDSEDPIRYRGTVILVITIITIASIGILQTVPQPYHEPELNVRIGIIDSGINRDASLETHIVAQKSFVNSSYGYPITDNTTTDSEPSGTSHGTYICKIIAARAPDAGIVIAKVVSKDDVATIDGVIAAIRWAILEENCSVINLSLGLELVSNDLIAETMRWAFNRGVSIVAAAGNNGQNGITGSSIDSPAAYPEVIAVAGVDENLKPFYFSGTGPLRDRTMKPDIAAWGFYRETGVNVFGTSFAAPVVSAVAAMIISHCQENGWSWTPGLVKAAIMASATPLSSESWLVGAGLVNLQDALLYIDNSYKQNGVPYVAAISPTESPFSFETVFVNQSIMIPISIFTSIETEFILTYNGDDKQAIRGPHEVTVNQTGTVTLEICYVSGSGKVGADAVISFVAINFQTMEIRFDFDAVIPYKKIAFDLSHTSWAMDSVYGQFRTLTSKLNNLGDSVDGLTSLSDITFDTLSQYDAVFVLDPCAWEYYMDNNSIKQRTEFTYTQDEINAYLQYWKQGGGLFLIGLSNDSLDLQNANTLYNAFNVTLNYDLIPSITLIVNGIASTTIIDEMADHPVTSFIDSFDYNGCSLNYTGDAYELAWKELSFTNQNGTIYKENRTVLVGMENDNGGRFLATGSNFFVDNWALNNLYQADQDWKLVLQSLFWLVHILHP